MKVLVIHTSYQYKGGEDTVVAEEIKLLQSAEIEVELLAFNNDENVLFKFVQLPFNFQSYFKTKAKLASFKPDVVHIHNLHFGGSASVIYAVKGSNLPVVVTLHNYRLLCPSGILFNDGKLFLTSLKQQFAWEAVKLGVYKNSKLITFWLGLSMYIHQKLKTWKKVNKYIVLSEHAKTLFLSSNLNLSENQFVIKPNFSSVSNLAKKQPEKYFLYVGRLSEEKGIMLLLAVFSQTNYKLKITGDGPFKEEVIRYSLKYSNIQYLGTSNKEEVLNLMQKCSALVFPSVWFEGMPLTIIEAFACGVPVISSKLGAMETMIIPAYNGLHFRAQDETDLNDKLNFWHQLDATEKQLYHLNARKTYEDLYTPEKNLKQLLSIYQEIIYN